MHAESSCAPSSASSSPLAPPAAALPSLQKALTLAIATYTLSVLTSMRTSRRVSASRVTDQPRLVSSSTARKSAIESASVRFVLTRSAALTVPRSRSALKYASCIATSMHLATSAARIA